MAYIEYVRVDAALEEWLARMGQTLDFGGPDLTANQNGRVSPNQRQRLLATGLALPLLAIGVGVLVSIAVRVIWAAYADAGPFSRSFSWTDIPGWVGLIVLLPTGYALFHVRSGLLKAAVDALYGRVGHVDGVLTAQMVEHEKKDRRHKQTETFADYYYVAGGKRLLVNRAAYDALLPGLACRVYYSLGTYQVLSLEPAPASAEDPGSCQGP